MKFIDKTGEIGCNNQGEKITIIAYRSAIDIDIQFEDGTIVYNRRYGNFKNGKIKHPIRYEESFAYHIEVELGLSLDNIWNWDKNNKLGINPYEITRRSSKKVWLYCLDKDYHNYDREGNKIGYQIICSNFYKGDRCCYCSNYKVHPKDSFAQYGIDTFGEYFLDKYWSNYNTLNPWEISPQSNKNIWLYCQEKDYHNYDREGNRIGCQITCNNFYNKKNKKRCGYCYNYKTHWKDSITHNYPEIAKMIAIKENNLTFEDCYSIAPFSNKKFYFKCLDCNIISNKKYPLSQIICHGFSCKICSDGLPISEKFMANILKQLDEDFITQLNKSDFKWCENFRYDFYLPRYNMIIETHGEQHYIEKITNNWKTLEQEQMNDLFKYKCAKNHVDKYIVIDCRYSELEWMKGNIIKELNEYFDLSNIKWELAWEESQNSLCVKAWELWNNGVYSTTDIGKILGLSRDTIRKYLKIGAECNKCSYPKIII